MKVNLNEKNCFYLKPVYCLQVTVSMSEDNFFLKVFVVISSK